jgi:hypothetical protein
MKPAAVLVITALSAGHALGQVPTPVNNTDFSKETENPVTRQITLPLQYQADFSDVPTGLPNQPLRSTRRLCRFGSMVIGR